jgi:hypothetical protein
MSDPSDNTAPAASGFWRQTHAQVALAASVPLALGLIVGGFMLGDGLTRAKAYERSVTVRGLAERDVTADLATWTLSYSATSPDFAAAQGSVDRDTASIRAFFAELGFPDDALQPTGVNVSRTEPVYSEGTTRPATVTVRQRVALRTHDIARAQQAVRRQFDLVRRGVMLEEGSGIAYAFTKLNAIKPQMVAEATRDARASAQQFANDSDTGVGAIKSATQGYFEVSARDGEGETEGGNWGAADTPYKKVRVVTTVEFALR